MEIKTSIVDSSAARPMKSLRWRVAQWFELRWWKNYLQDKNKEEYLDWKKSYWQNILTLVSNEIKLNPSKTIIDLGCGPAGVFIALPENKIVAVDPLIEEYEKQTLFFERRDYPNTSFIKSTIEEFEINQKFDIVFCMNCINHVQNLEKGFEKLKEVCAGNGRLVLSIDAHNISFFKHLFRLIPGDILHPHQYDLQEYKTFLEKQGFKMVRTELLKQKFLFGHWVLVAQRN